MLTIKPEIKKGECSSTGKYNVKIRLTYKRQVKRLPTSIYLGKSDLTKNLSIKENTPIKRDIDNLVKSYQDRIAKLQIELNDYTLDEITDYLKGERERTKSIDFLVFCDEWINTTTAKGKKNYKSALNAFKAYIGKSTLTTSQITKPLLEGFMAYLMEHRAKKVEILIKEGKRIPSNRIVSLYMGSLRHLFNEARKKFNDYDRNIILIPNNPFENLSIPKQEVTRKRAIAPELIKKIYDLPYKLRADGRERESSYNLAKDCFLLSFCLMGMNSVDLHTCTIYENGTIIYNRCKTTDRRLDNARMEVTVPSFIMPILEKHIDKTGTRVFDFYRTYNTPTNFNRAINKGLKEIGEILGIEDLEFYAARHSWATIALNKVGIDKYTVHTALNHVDESMKVTDIYIERDFVAENNANQKVINYVFN